MGNPPNPEVSERATRRRFSAEYKLGILEEADRCALGEQGALSGWPLWDLIAGAGIGSLVLWGGVRILKEARGAIVAASQPSSTKVNDPDDPLQKSR